MARHSGGSYSKTRSIQAEKHPQLDQSPQQNPQQPQRITQMSQTQMSPFSDAPTTSSSSTSKCFCGGGQKDYNLRVAGPSMGGKTSLIRYLQHGQFTAETAPTNEMEVSRVFWSGTPFIVWDSRKFPEDDMKPAKTITPNLATGDKQMIAKRHHIDALVYVVDASDPGRLKIGTRDFERLLRTYHDVPVVLVLGTKGDRVTAVNRHDIQTQLRVLESAYDREVAVFLVSSVTGSSIDEAMEWLTDRVRRKEGVWISIFDVFNCRRARESGTISCGRFGNWDPFSMCRFSRLS